MIQVYKVYSANNSGWINIKMFEPNAGALNVDPPSERAFSNSLQKQNTIPFFLYRKNEHNFINTRNTISCCFFFANFIQKILNEIGLQFVG